MFIRICQYFIDKFSILPEPQQQPVQKEQLQPVENLEELLNINKQFPQVYDLIRKSQDALVAGIVCVSSVAARGREPDLACSRQVREGRMQIAR